MGIECARASTLHLCRVEQFGKLSAERLPFRLSEVKDRGAPAPSRPGGNRLLISRGGHGVRFGLETADRPQRCDVGDDPSPLPLGDQDGPWMLEGWRKWSFGGQHLALRGRVHFFARLIRLQRRIFDPRPGAIGPRNFHYSVIGAQWTGDCAAVAEGEIFRRGGRQRVSARVDHRRIDRKPEVFFEFAEK